jgi:hypothetical protein
MSSVIRLLSGAAIFRLAPLEPVLPEQGCDDTYQPHDRGAGSQQPNRPHEVHRGADEKNDESESGHDETAWSNDEWALAIAEMFSPTAIGLASSGSARRKVETGIQTPAGHR